MKAKYLFFFLLCASFGTNAQQIYYRTATLMSSRFDLTIVDKNDLEAKKHLDTLVAEVERIENLISEWRPETQVSQINRMAGLQAVKVDREVFDLTKRAIHYAEITDGALDISFAAMDKLWKFDGSMKQLPSEEEIKKSLIKVGYQYIVLDSVNNTIFLKLHGMKIGFGSIGKAYAADKGRKLMEAMGVKGGIVNAAGDIAAWGRNNKGKKWKIGITNPFDESTTLSKFKIDRAAVTTSGSYEKYVQFEGKRYAHIINPKTGWPSTGLISVTIRGENAEFANALSTSIMVLGEVKGLELLNKYPNYSGLFITDNHRIIRSENFK